MSALKTSIINEIKKILRDSYHSGFPILKELIQNADDSGATHFIFGDHSGFSQESKHPLLQGSALWFTNNGNFKESDKDAIASFSVNAKAGESQTIGKYGLGMKSVFHLCESFFYIASDGKEIHQDFINPWANNKQRYLHSDWDKVDENDWLLIKNACSDFHKSDDKWFVLWVPLRKKSHLFDQEGKECGTIRNEFPGDQIDSEALSFLGEPDLPQNLGRLIPLLSNIQEIEFKPLDGRDWASYHLKFQSSKRLALTIQSDDEKIISNGEVSIECNGKPKPNIVYSGQKFQSNNVIFSKYLKHSSWPETLTTNEQGFEEPVNDKSRPEGAVVINHTDASHGKVTIQWAVFLPLEEKELTFIQTLKGSSRHYQFILHGQFFIDAGRRGINGFSQFSKKPSEEVENLNEKDLCQYWNRELAQRVTLPLLLPTLSEYIRQQNLKDEETTLLTEAVSEFARKYSDYICHKFCWIKRVDPDSSEWYLLKIDESRILPIPAPPKDDPSRPWRVLPSLTSMEGICFRDSNAPQILPASSQSEQWKEADLIQLFSKHNIDIFIKTKDLSYLRDILSLINLDPFLKQPSIQSTLLKFIKSGIQDHPLKLLRKNKQKIQHIISFLNKENRLALGPIDNLSKSSIPDKLWTALWSCESNILPLPSYLDSVEIKSEGKPSRDDVNLWLKEIQEHITSNSLEKSVMNLTYELLKNLPNNEREILVKSQNNLRLIRAYNPRLKCDVSVSHSEIIKSKDRGCLFALSGFREQQKLMKLLVNVLPDEEVLLLRKDDRELFFPNTKLPASNSPVDILKSLPQTDKNLGNLESRKALLAKVHTTDNDKNAILGLRYLLHGDIKHRLNVSDTLWQGGYKQSPAWEKLWKVTTGIQGGKNWQVISRQLTEGIPQTSWADLNLSEIKPESVLNKLTALSDYSFISNTEFLLEEREEILSRVDDNDLWKNLPLHTTISGDIKKIDRSTFLQADIELPSILNERVTIIEPSTILASQQNNWIPKLDTANAAKLVLQSTETNLYCLFLLELLEKIDDYQLDHLSEYKSKEWLLLKNQKVIAPSDVIDIPLMESEIQRLSSEADYCYASKHDLSEQVLKHKAYKKLETLFSSTPKDALEKLGLLLDNMSGYNIGLYSIGSNEKLRNVSTILKDCPYLLGWSVINKVIANFSEEDCIEYLLPNLQSSLKAERIKNILDWLHSKSSSKATPVSISPIYLEYLKQLINVSNGVDYLPNIYLQTQNKKIWKKASELCFGVASIDKSYLLHKEYAEVLNSEIHTSSRNTNGSSQAEQENLQDYTQLEEKTPKILAKYFKEWGNLCRTPVIGALIGLLSLGRGKKIREQAINYLEPHTFDWFTEAINWRDPGERDDGVTEWMGNICVEEALNKLQFTIEIVTEKQEQVTNLFSDSISVPLASINDDSSSLISGNLGGVSEHVHIKLREIDVYKYQEELPRLIRNSCNFILLYAYNQKGKINRKTLWDTLNETDQLEIEVVRARIFKHLTFYLKQLGAHQLPEIKDTVLQYEKEDTQLTEARTKKRSNEEITRLEKKQDITQKNLVKILAEDSMAQAGLLEKMRQKLFDYQYESNSILFELYQNADDAVTELGKCESYPSNKFTIPNASKHFNIIQKDNTFYVMHWGRPINYRGTSEIKEKWPGYGQDLEKMLILSASDKPEDKTVTGRFGLGFKSVFLACDEPRLLSGDLRVKIVASILPEPWIEDYETSLKLLGEHTQDRRYKGTLLELPINTNIKISDVGDRFKKLIYLLPIFSTSIRHIRFNEKSSSWTPEILCNNNILETSKVNRFDRLLVSRVETENGRSTVAFQLEARGFNLFSKEIPSLWVTVPTREDFSFGFIISAPFRIDAGRGKLAGDGQENIELAIQLGKKIGSDLATLYQEDWQMLISKLDLASDVTQAEFWTSLWLKLTERTLGHHESIANIGQQFIISLLSKWSEKLEVIPNGFSANQAKLVSYSMVTHALPKRWVQDSEVMTYLNQWELFRNKYATKQLISEKMLRIWRKVSKDSRIVTLTTQNLIGLLGDNGYCDNRSAETLQSIFNCLFNDTTKESLDDSVKKLMTKLVFKSKANDKQKSKLLLCTTHAEKEEKLRAAFAPDEFLLSDDYSNLGIKFFRQCRSRADISEYLQQWVINASKTKQETSLRYILDGEKGTDLAQKIRGELSGTWLDDFSPNHPAIKDWSKEDKDQICRLLMPEMPTLSPQMQSDPPIRKYSETTLEQIYNWWVNEGQANKLNNYYKKLYPKGKIPDLRISDEGSYKRESWMMLFALGVSQSLGRVKSSQNRGFIEYLQSNQWWKTFCKNPIDDGEQWLEVLHEYAKNQNDDESYSQWIDSYPRLFKIATWLNDYIDLFESIDQRTADQGSHILIPNTDIALQGAGWGEIPPLNRTLKYGFHLIIRELIKQGIISTHEAHGHAYMPVQRIREMISEITGDKVETSQEIFEVLCEELGKDKATFSGDFDIPLLILAETPSLVANFGIELEPEEAY